VVKKDDVEAINWFRKSAAQGNTRAQRSLEELDNGEISEQDAADATRIQADVVEAENKLIKKYGEVVTKTATMNLRDQVGNPAMVLNLKIKMILSTLEITGEMSLENMQKNLPDSIMRYNPIIESKKDGVISLAFYEAVRATNAENIMIKAGEKKTRKISFTSRLKGGWGDASKTFDAKTEAQLLSLKQELIQGFLDGSRDAYVYVNPSSCKNCEIYFEFH